MKNSLKTKLVAGALFLVILVALMLSGLQTVESSKTYLPIIQVPTEAPYEAVKGTNIWHDVGVGYDDEMEESELEFVRIDLIWRNVEPDADGTYYWNNDYSNTLEDDIDAIVSAGLTPWVIINSPPEGYLSSGSGCQVVQTDHYDEFANFALAAQWHFMYVDHWEIFNEADLDRGEGFLSSSGGIGCYGGIYKNRYINMFEAAYGYITAINPSGKLYIASLSWDDCDDIYDPTYGTCHGADWIEYMLTYIDDYDGFGFHFYVSKGDAQESSFDLDDLFAYVEDLADTYDTEYAFTETALKCMYADEDDCYESTFENRQADWAEIAHNYCGSNTYCKWWGWYALLTPDWPRSYPQTGIYHVGTIDEGGKKPVYYKIKDLPSQ